MIINDKRTIHLLPPASNKPPNPCVGPRSWYNEPNLSSYHAHMSSLHEKNGKVVHTNFSGRERGPVSSQIGLITKPYVRRYAALVVKDGMRFVAKIISSLSIDDWAKENGYNVLKCYRINGAVNEKIEKTEFIDCGPDIPKNEESKNEEDDTWTEIDLEDLFS